MKRESKSEFYDTANPPNLGDLYCVWIGKPQCGIFESDGPWRSILLDLSNTLWEVAQCLMISEFLWNSWYLLVMAVSYIQDLGGRKCPCFYR